MSIPYKENSAGQKILSYLGETSKGLFELGMTVIFEPHIFLHGTPFDCSQRELKKSIYQFKRNGYLEKKQGKLYVTEKGRAKIIKNILKNKKNKERRKWDGKWRGIIFDIPEASRKDRDFLRRELKRIGLVEVQQSVWLFPFDIEKELGTLLKLWKTDFKGDIRFVLIEKMNDKDLRQAFDLI